VRNERRIPRSQQASTRSVEITTPGEVITISPTRKSGSSISSGDFLGGLTPLALGAERRSGAGGVLRPSDVTTVRVGRFVFVPRGKQSCGPPSISSSSGLGPRITRRSPVLANVTP